MSNLTSSAARKGETVTTINKYGGLGIGHLIEGEVWVNTGSVWACPAKNDVVPMVNYIRDGGAGYRLKARKLTGM